MSDPPTNNPNSNTAPTNAGAPGHPPPPQQIGAGAGPATQLPFPRYSAPLSPHMAQVQQLMPPVHHQPIHPIQHQQMHSIHPQNPPQNQNQPQDGQTSRSLNVRDALEYLDKVKDQFRSQPEVYNRFLDIMKDFKSQSIDTPGVIDRVSTLFRGHPSLVTGFNTFLPPGYRIEATMNPLDPIRVWTPTGLQAPRLSQQQPQSQTPPASGPPPVGQAPLQSQQPPIQQQSQPQQLQSGPSRTSPAVPHYPIAPAGSAPPPQQYFGGQQSSQQHQMPIPNQTGPGYQNIPTSHLPPPSIPPPSQQSHPSQLAPVSHADQSMPPVKKAPIEFSHAISYVNKIKTRFSNEPEIYKQFLEIFQTYQRDNKPILEVYSQVQILFSNAPDLLEEFKMFLPEMNDAINKRSAPAAGGLAAKGSAAGSGGSSSGGGRMPPLGTFAAADMRRTSGGNLAPMPAVGLSGMNGGNNNQKKPKRGGFGPSVGMAQQQQQQHQQVGYPGGYAGRGGSPTMMQMPGNGVMGSGPTGGPLPGGQPPTKRKKYDATSAGNVAPPAGYASRPTDGGGYVPGGPVVPGPGANASHFPGDAQLSAPPPGNSYPHHLGPNGGNLEELEWIDRCKRSIANKAVYNEFLKVLNLFSNEIIDSKTLVERVEPFLAKAPDLFTWFKKFVKYEEEQVVYNYAANRPDVDWRTCRRVGYSYRRMPDNVPRSACSGRDDLCREVLNDDWVAQADYTSSETGGFISHKKTIYEEALHKCEEERYEFDMNIEANQYTIALLEPIYRRINTMSPEERAKFKLPVGLGGVSKTIYQRVIKKIYDVEKGTEMIDALHNNPAVAVPIVLRRLKQKDEEWKRCQRDWNKVWREIDAKNYFKALDHQGITFKVTDRKSLSSKTLLTEIETLYREQRERRRTALPQRATPSAYYAFVSNSKLGPGPLTSTAFSRHQMDFTLGEGIGSVFRDARRLVLMHVGTLTTVSQGEEDRFGDFFNNFLKRFFCLDGPEVVSDDDGLEGSVVEDGATDGGDESQGFSRQTLRKEVLMKQTAFAAGDSSTASTHGAATADVDMLSDTESVSTKVTSTRVRTSIKREYFPFFCNSSLYVMFRLFEILCARLAKLKELSDEYQTSPPSFMSVINPTAVSLGLQQPDAVESQTPKSKDRYAGLMRAVHELFESKIDATEYEDRLRGLFGTTAYLGYTLDKVVSTLVKQIQVVMADPLSNDLLELYLRDRSKHASSARQENVYRLNAERLLEDDNLYRLDYHVAPKVLTMQLLTKEDAVLQDSTSVEELWSVYVDQFIQLTGNSNGVGYNDPHAIQLPRRGHAVHFATNNGPVFGSEPYLRRTLNLDVEHSPGGILNDAIEMRSGLELKICLNTYKMFFVEDTEDYFARRGMKKAGRTAASNAQAKEKLNAWIEERWAEIEVEDAAGEDVMDIAGDADKVEDSENVDPVPVNSGPPADTGMDVEMQ
ncbi:Transcriptional regulatory protein sin3 [Chytriomyces hyalinus]|nr:Transcriptional regulatory protein sin3 [Chytriomyces hyalinus]